MHRSREQNAELERREQRHAEHEQLVEQQRAEERAEARRLREQLLAAKVGVGQAPSADGTERIGKSSPGFNAKHCFTPNAAMANAL